MKRHPIELPYKAATLFIMISISISIFVNNGFDPVLLLSNHIIVGIIFFYATINIYHKNEKFIFIILIGSYIIIAFTGFLQLITHQGMLIQGYMRINSIFIHPNIFGMYLIIMISIFMSLFFKYKSCKEIAILRNIVIDTMKIKIFFTISISSAFLLLWSTGSRNAIFTGVGALMMTSLFYHKINVKKLLIGLAITGILGLISIYLFYDFQRIEDRVLQGIATANGRFYLWDAFLKIDEKTFWVGIGATDFDDFLRQIDKRFYVFRYYHMHNVLIDTIVKHGFITLIFLMILIGAIIKNNLIKIKRNLNLFSIISVTILVSLTIIGLTESVFQNSSIVLLLFFILGLSHRQQVAYE